MADRSPAPERVRDDRIWASQWYRVRPETFEYFELFFEPDRISGVFGDESFQSLLLRRDGREREAREVGERYADAPPEELASGERSFVVDADDVTEIRLTEGSLLLKPKLVIETLDRTDEFYHHSRSHEVSPLVDLLDSLYDDAEVPVTVRERGLVF
jgi:hypothetical protein